MGNCAGLTWTFHLNLTEFSSMFFKLIFVILKSFSARVLCYFLWIQSRDLMITPIVDLSLVLKHVRLCTHFCIYAT